MQLRGTSTVLLATGIAAALLLVASTGAVVFDEPADQLTDDVALQPGDNPYTYLDEDDELTVDVTEDNPHIDGDGVNPDTFAAQSALFYITYDGNESAEAWIEHDAEAVAFVVDGDPVESEETAVRLGPDRQHVAVGVEVDTRIVDVVPGDRLIDSIDVHARSPEPEATGGSGGGTGPSVAVDAPDDATREIDVAAATAGGETSADLDGLQLGESWIRLDELSFVPTASGDFAFTVAGSTDLQDGADPVDRPGVDPLAHYRVTFDDVDSPTDDATARIAVDRDRLDERGIDPHRLVVYHGTDDGWERLPTTVAADGDTVQLTAESAGFSAFAVAVEGPALEPIDAAVEPAEVAPGEELTLGVELRNVGPAPATDAELAVRSAADVDATDDSESPEADSEPTTPGVVSGGVFAVDAEPGENATATVDLAVTEPGVHDLVVDGDAVAEPTTVATVAVTEPADEPDLDEASGPDSAADADSAAGTDDTVASSPGDEPVEPAEPAGLDPADFGGLLALLAIVLVSLTLVRRMPR